MPSDVGPKASVSVLNGTEEEERSARETVTGAAVVGDIFVNGVRSEGSVLLLRAACRGLLWRVRACRGGASRWRGAAVDVGPGRFLLPLGEGADRHEESFAGPRVDPFCVGWVLGGMQRSACRRVV